MAAHFRHRSGVISMRCYRREKTSFRHHLHAPLHASQTPVRNTISMRCCVVSRRRRKEAAWCKGLLTPLLAFRLGIEAVQTSFLDAAWCKGLPTPLLAFRLGIRVVHTSFWHRPQSTTSFGSVIPLPALLDDCTGAILAPWMIRL